MPKVIVTLFLLCPMFTAWAGHQSRPHRNDAEFKPDYELTRREIQSLETVIDGVINSTFVNPFALVQKTKGVYLQGYGVTFHFLVNIHSAIVNTPFGTLRSGPEITAAEKKRRIDELMDKMVRTLVTHGDGLRQIRKEDSVTLVAFFDDRTLLDEKTQKKTLILRALKKDLDELAHQESRWKELKQRMEIIEY